MTTSIVFDPLLPWWLIASLFGMVLTGIALALWRGLSGWALRALGATVILAALIPCNVSLSLYIYMSV